MQKHQQTSWLTSYFVRPLQNIDPHIIEHQLAHSVPDSLGNACNRTKFIDKQKNYDAAVS